MKSSPARHLHTSNLVTYLGLLAGMFAIFTALEFGSRFVAGALIALSVLADTLDGRFARLFDRDAEQQQFGGQLDSLCDVICFGLVPVMCVYTLTSYTNEILGWGWYAAAFFYVIATMTRLAFYNIQSEDNADFIGVPTPFCGLVWAAYLLFPTGAANSLLLLVLGGAAMVWPVRVPRPTGLGLYAFMLSSLLVAIMHGLLYILEIRA
jgi:CDP-diacylglycerol--serine O-phosphatidyltransferase